MTEQFCLEEIKKNMNKDGYSFVRIGRSLLCNVSVSFMSKEKEWEVIDWNGVKTVYSNLAAAVKAFVQAQ